MYMLVLKQLLTMTLIVIAGFIFAKITKVGEKEQKFLSRLLLLFINPCLVFSCFNMEFDSEKLKQLGFVALISLVIQVVMVLVATCVTHSKDKTLRDYNHIDRIGIVFTNCGFIGIPLIRGVFGNEGVFFLMGYLVIFNVLVWTYGSYEMTGTINIKKIITNPNIIAVVLGIILFCMPFTLPEFIAKPISMIGDLNTAVAMLMIGILLADFKLEKKYALNLTKVTIFRLIVVPLVNLLVLFLVYKLCEGSIDNVRLMLFVILICSMCPSATSVPSLAVLYNKDSAYASLIVSITSILCVFTVPTFVALAEQLIK